MTHTSAELNYTWAVIALEELYRLGVEVIGIAPGARSGPLAMAAFHHPRLRVVTHIDERGLAFMALGQAVQSQKPVALITTSGTAVANLFPAVVEASLQYVPLIILSADRPPDMLASGANQTIDQIKLYGSYVRFSMAISEPTAHTRPETLLTTLDQAVHTAMFPQMAGPVHLNFHFRAPLFPAEFTLSPIYFTGQMKIWQSHERPYTTIFPSQLTPNTFAIHPLIELIKQARQGLVILGNGAATADAQALIHWLNQLQWPVLADITSGLKSDPRCTCLVPNPDWVLGMPDTHGLLKADTLVYIGDAVTSSAFLTFLESTKPDILIKVQDQADRHDPFHQVTHRITDIAGFCKTAVMLIPESEPGERTRALVALGHHLSPILTAFEPAGPECTEPGIADCIWRQLPVDHTLMIGNSMPIRLMTMFSTHSRPQPVIHTNRGASGIDGLIATAMGLAMTPDNPVTLLLGDMSFLHDLNSLALLKQTQSPVLLVVLNNAGCGIFSHLPIGAHKTVCDPVFTLSHDLNFEQIASGFSLPFHRVTRMDDFESSYRHACLSGQSLLLECRVETARTQALIQHIKTTLATRARELIL